MIQLHSHVEGIDDKESNKACQDEDTFMILKIPDNSFMVLTTISKIKKSCGVQAILLQYIYV